MLEPEGIEPLAATPLNNGYRVTAGNGEQAPINCNTLRYAFRRRRRANEECVLKQTTESTNIILVPLRGRSKREQFALIRYLFTHSRYRQELIIR